MEGEGKRGGGGGVIHSSGVGGEGEGVSHREGEREGSEGEGWLSLSSGCLPLALSQVPAPT